MRSWSLHHSAAPVRLTPSVKQGFGYVGLLQKTVVAVLCGCEQFCLLFIAVKRATFHSDNKQEGGLSCACV
jgi:hypothetical protein